MIEFDTLNDFEVTCSSIYRPYMPKSFPTYWVPSRGGFIPLADLVLDACIKLIEKELK